MAKNKSAFAGMNFTQVMMQQAQRSLDNPIYCRYCGKDIKQPSKESTQYDKGYSSPWELENNAHTSCYQKHYGGRR